MQNERFISDPASEFYGAPRWVPAFVDRPSADHCEREDATYVVHDVGAADRLDFPELDSAERVLIGFDAQDGVVWAVQ